MLLFLEDRTMTTATIKSSKKNLGSPDVVREIVGSEPFVCVDFSSDMRAYAEHEGEHS